MKRSNGRLYTREQMEVWEEVAAQAEGGWYGEAEEMRDMDTKVQAVGRFGRLLVVGESDAD